MSDEESRLLSDEEEIRDVEDSGDEEEEETRQKSKHRDYDDEDDDDDEDEDEDDDDDDEDAPKKKKARKIRNRFVELEAEVDTSEDEEEEDEDALQEEGFIQNEEDDDEVADARNDRLHREVDRRREEISDIDAERLADEYREKYGRSAAGSFRGESNAVSQRLLLPSVNDPNIWGVRCKTGKEKEIIRLIMKKCLNMKNTKHPLEIYSAFQRDGFSGYIYLEARKADAVDLAIKGLVGVYGREKIMVPIKEYTDLLRATKKNEVELLPGAYVRIKRGKYTGDLAVVENLSENGLEARLKVVPRLDYGKYNNDADAPEGAVKKRPFGGNSVKDRPQPRLFSEQDALAYDAKSLQRRGMNSFIYKGDEYEDGYLFKDFKLSFLETKNVAPTLEELTRFDVNGEEGIDLQSVANSLKKSVDTATFEPGDKVEVFEGEQTGVLGSVVAAAGDIVTIVVTSGPLGETKLDVPTASLRKKFGVGDHVRVVNGKHKDETGLVVATAKDQVTVVSDLTETEFTVFTNYLVEASGVGGANRVGEYEMFDLVQVGTQEVGVLVKVEREMFTVLVQTGKIKQVSPSSVSFKLGGSRGDRNAFATDRNGLELRVGDTVKEAAGERRQGNILHIYRSYVFVHNRTISENMGVFVVPVENLETVAAKGSRFTTDISKMKPQGPAGQKPDEFQPKRGGRDKTIHQYVTICRGPYKGLQGIVKDATDFTAQVELHTKNKVVTVNKEFLLFHVAGNRKVPYGDFMFPRGRAGGPPFDEKLAGANTPFAGGRTPAWSSGAGSRTPGWGAGARTPAWSSGGAGSAGGRTPAFQGGRTPAWGGAGGRTPAWNAGGGRTPAWNAGGGRTPAWGGNGGGNRTPGWSSGSRSAWDPNASAEVSGSGAAPTPSASGAGARSWEEKSSSTQSGWGSTAKTPGAFAAPTPSAYGGYGAPTPAAAPTPASAPTPGGESWGYEEAKTPGVASTPSAWGNDED